VRMTEPDTQRILLVAQVKSLLEAYVERFGTNPYVSIDLDMLDYQQLSVIRRNLHEVLYAPPSRRT